MASIYTEHYYTCKNRQSIYLISDLFSPWAAYTLGKENI